MDTQRRAYIIADNKLALKTERVRGHVLGLNLRAGQLFDAENGCNGDDDRAHADDNEDAGAGEATEPKGNLSDRRAPSDPLPV